jgi:hypothetical protein
LPVVSIDALEKGRHEFVVRFAMSANGMVRPYQQEKLARGTKDEERTMSSKDKSAVVVIGID